MVLSWTIGDLLALEVFHDVVAGDRALLVVAAAGAEDVPHVALGDLRVGGGRRDLQDAVLLIDVGGRHGDAGIEVADDELHAVAGELVGDRDALLRIGRVVADSETVIFWPRMPPAALISSMACSAPFLSCAPKAAFGPVIGPATPNLICACGAAGKRRRGQRQTRGQTVHDVSLYVEASGAPRLDRLGTIEAPNAAKVTGMSTFRQCVVRAPAQQPGRSLSQRYCVTIWRRARRPEAENPKTTQTSVSTK